MRGVVWLCVWALVVVSSVVAYADEGATIWTKSPNHPVLAPSDDPTWFDSDYMGGGPIVYDENTGKYFLYYCGYSQAKLLLLRLVEVNTIYFARLDHVRGIQEWDTKLFGYLAEAFGKA